MVCLSVIKTQWDTSPVLSESVAFLCILVASASKGFWEGEFIFNLEIVVLWCQHWWAVSCTQTCWSKMSRDQGQVFTDALHAFCLLIPLSLCCDIARSLWETRSWFLKFYVSGMWFCQEMRYSEGRVYGLLKSGQSCKDLRHPASQKT